MTPVQRKEHSQLLIFFLNFRIFCIEAKVCYCAKVMESSQQLVEKLKNLQEVRNFRMFMELRN